MTLPLQPAGGAPEVAECAGLPLLDDLDPGVRARILARCRAVGIPAGTIILEKGAANDTLHFLLAGTVHIHFDLASLEHPIVVPPGRMFGEMSVIDDLPVSAWVLAGTDCRVLLVPAELFWGELVTTPGAARQVMRSLAGLLRNNAASLAAALQEKLKHEALARELSLARDIQMGMVRRADPWFPGQRRFEIAASMEPAKLVGGDFYDAFLLDDDHLVVALGDVAGKGISAALFMVRALTLLRSHAQRWQSLAATVAGVNDALAADNEAAMFLSMFMGVLDLREGTLDYVNHGHAPPLLRAPDGRAALHPVKPGIVLGMMEGARGAAGTLRLPPGGTLMLYSDGVTEAEDPAQAQLGEAAMLAAAAALPAPEARSLIEGLAAAVAAHAGTAEQADDITMLAVRWLG